MEVGREPVISEEGRTSHVDSLPAQDRGGVASIGEEIECEPSMSTILRIL